MSAKTASARILHNSFWYGLEQIIETVVFFATSVAVARYLGPEKLGYFSYINFFVMVVNRTSGTALAGATRKYMAEFLGLGQPELARAVYFYAYRYQLLGSVSITALGLIGVVAFGEPSFRLMASLLILSIIPGSMSWVPAQANQAFEDVSKNTLSALGYIVTYTVTIVLTLHFRWDLVGVASAALVGRTVELVLRTIPLHIMLRAIPVVPVPQDLALRIRNFVLHSMGIQLLSCIVWERSEFIFLKWFSSLQQIAFYSISFGLAGNLLLIPRTFGGASGMTLMVEAARDPRRIASLVPTSVRYLCLVTFPVHLGAAAIAAQAVRLAYGKQYLPAIPVLVVAVILAIPRAFSDGPDTLMRVFDRQDLALRWMIVIGIVNVALDAALIPFFGATGAAWANGVAQFFGIVCMWIAVRRLCVFSWPTGTTLRLLAAAGGMAAFAYGVGRFVPGTPGMVAAVVLAAPLYVVLVRLSGALDESDRKRFESVGSKVPTVARAPLEAVIRFVAPA